MRTKPGGLLPSSLVIAGALLTSCGSGPSESKFVTACMTEGRAGASQMLDKELGISREAFCKCGAPVAKASLSADGYRAMILDMEGKGEEARAITAKMSEAEQQASLEVRGQMLERCAGGGQ